MSIALPKVVFRRLTLIIVLLIALPGAGGSLAAAPGPVTITAGSSSGLPDTEVLVPIQVSNFSNVWTFQFSFHWDPAIVTFIAIEEPGLIGLPPGNFNTAQSNAGTFTVVWYDPLVVGTNLADGASLFKVRFKCVSVPGTSTSLTIDSTPTAFEVTDDSQPLPASAVAGALAISHNQPPVLGNIGNKTVNEGSLLSFTAPATDVDTPTQTLTFSLDSGAPAGASIHPTSGAFTWTPTEAQGPSTNVVTVRVTDNGSPAASDFETITIVVSEVNVAPVLGNIGNKTVNEGTPLSFTATATDADLPSQTLTFSLDSGAPAGASIHPTSGAFTWTPTEAQGPGTNVVTVRVTDNGSPALNDFETITIVVSEVNAAPVLGNIGNRAVNEGGAVSFTATATDADVPAQTLTFSLDFGAPAGASINPTSGAFTWTPTESQGPSTNVVTIRVTDNGSPALNDFETITIVVSEVNIAPVLATIGNKTVNEGTLLGFTVTATDTDLPAQTLTYSLDAGAPVGASINASSGAFTWTPTEAEGPSTNLVTIRVTDNGSPALSDFQTITIVVSEGNVAPVLAGIGNRTVNEGNAVSFTAIATDADVPVQTLTFSLDSGSPAGASIDASSGVFIWTPTEAQGPSTNLVTVRVTDNGSPALSDFETITIIVSEVNTAPVLASIGNWTVNEGTLLSFTATATDADLPAQTLTFSLDAGAPAGASINASSGVFIWTPTEAQGPSTNVVTVRVTDNGSPAQSDSETITIVVNEVNTAPVLATIGNKTVTEETLLNFTATATDADLPTQMLTFSLDVGAPAGASINPTSGAFTWTPAEMQGPSTNTVTIRVTDNGSPALSDFETITIVVSEASAAPVLASIGSWTVNEGILLSFTVMGTDADVPAQTLTFSLDAGAPAGASIHPTSGAFTWTPTEAQGPSTNLVTIRVTDNGSPAQSDSETITIVVNEVNAAPVLATIGNKTVNEGALLSFTAMATDADLPAQMLTFSLDAGAPAGASIHPTSGAFTWTPTEVQGPSTNVVTIRVTDNGSPGQSDFETITIVVSEGNVAPVLAGIGNRTVNEGSAVTFTATATDADLPGQTLMFSLDAGAPAGASINASNGAFTWTPTEAQGPSTNLVTVRVTDNGSPALSDFETITIVVSEVSVAPVLAPIGNWTVNEGTVLSFTATATDADLPAQTLAFSLDAGFPAGASIHPTSGAFTWTPTEAQGPSTNVVTIRVTDNGSPTQSDSKTITIVVNEVSVAPVLTSIGNRTANEGTQLSFTATATDADLPAQTLTFSLDFGAPAGASINTSSGVFTWTPTEAQGPSTNVVTIRVTDNGSPVQSDSETITIVVGEVNAAPVLGNIGNRAVNEGSTVSFTATATDADAPAQTLTFSLDSGAPAGASIHPTSGAFTWTPTEAQGPSTNVVTVRVTDNGSPAQSGSETITIVVNEMNTAPVLATIGNRTVNEGILLSFTVAATDADQPVQTLNYSLDAGAPVGASINASSGAFTWTPTEAQGPSTNLVTIRVTDNGELSLNDFETITIVVSEANAAPVLAGIGSRTVNEDSAVSFTATATDADSPAQTLTFSLDAGAPAGASINASSGAFTWTPTEAQGPSTNLVTVRVTDNGSPALSDFETITIIVSEVNTAPVLASIGNWTVNEGTLLSFTAAATDANLPVQTLTYSLDVGAPAGASIHPTSGAFAWTPTEAQGPSTNTVTIRVTDNGTPAQSDSETITIVVNEFNTAPVLATIGNKSVIIGSAVTFTALANDPDLPTQLITFSIDPGAPPGATIDAFTGNFSWTPTEAYIGTANFVTVRVTDNGSPARSSTETIALRVYAMPTISIRDASVPGGADGTLVAEFEVNLSLPTTLPVLVNFTTASGSALAGGDFVSTNGTVTFAPGVTNATIDVTVFGKSTVYTNRAFLVHLSNPTNCTVDIGSALGTIEANPAPGFYVNDVTVMESNGGATAPKANAVFTVTLLGGSDRLVTVDYATVGITALPRKDFAPKKGQLKFLPGITTQTITVPIVGEMMSEYDETFQVNLSRPVNAVIIDGQGQATILDDDPLPAFTVADVATVEPSAGTRAVAFLVRLSSKSGRSVSVDFATADGTAAVNADYFPVSGTLIFPPGTTQQRVFVNLIGNTMNENDEAFFLDLSNSINANIGGAHATAHIRDSDRVPLVSVSDGVMNGSQILFAMYLSAPSEKTITANYSTTRDSAIAGTDFVLTNGELTFAPGETQKTIGVSLLPNPGAVDSRRFFLQILGAVNTVLGDRSGTGTIPAP